MAEPAAPETQVDCHISEEPGQLKRKSLPDSLSTSSPPKRPKRSASPNGRRSQTRATSLRSPSTPRRRSRSPNRTRADPGSREGRASFSQEERRRGQRLFGGLLNTLNQAGPGSNHQLKRREIEQRQRQLDQARRQRIDEDQRKTELARQLTRTRKREQIDLDELVMIRRHANMRAVAHYLRTVVEPCLYYLPWKLTTDQRAIIDKQIDEADAIIERETHAFSTRRESYVKGFQPSEPGPRQSPSPPEREDKAEAAPISDDSRPQSDADKTMIDCTKGSGAMEEQLHAKVCPKVDSPTPDQGATGNLVVDDAPAEVQAPKQAPDRDDSGDVIVEGHEDMVIY